MSERKAFTVDQNYHKENVFFEEVLRRSAIETSEFLILTHDDKFDKSKPGVCFVAETADYTVHGDVVRVCGPIKCKSVKIVCRTLQFWQDTKSKDAAIIVDGEKGKDGDVVTTLPKDGEDAVGDAGDGTEGKPGEPGNKGDTGADGGKIEVYCETLRLACPTTLSANGGQGGSGSSGTAGGRGGAGRNDPTAWQDAGNGAPGSAGGAGGPGNNGGNGGAITLTYNEGNARILRDRLLPGESLKPDESISSLNGRYTLKYQTDGRLVLYRNPDGKELWDTKKVYHGAAICIMQGDGNLVIYDTLPSPGRTQYYVWLSATSNNPGSRLVVQDDGNVVIYRPDGTAVWETNTPQGDEVGQLTEVLTFSARGGDGGAGGTGGNGGRAGDAGWTNRAEDAVRFGKVGEGGKPGPGGKGGYGGAGGFIRVATLKRATPDSLSVSHGRQGADGANGEEGAYGGWRGQPPDKHPGTIWAGPAAQQLAIAPGATANSATDGSFGIEQFSYDALREQVPLSSLRMLVERLRYRFLRLGRSDWTVDPEQQDKDLLELFAGIQWIQNVLGAGSSVDAADKSMAAALLQSTNSLNQNLRKGKDYFGNTSTYVALGTVNFFQEKKEEALKHLQDAEDEYRQYRTAMNESAESQAGMQLAFDVAGTWLDKIKREAKETIQDSAAALAKVNQLRDLLDAKGKALKRDAGDLNDEVYKKWGVSLEDLFGCLTQFSFQHWGNLPEKIESGPALMAAGQVGDLMNKGISNVVTDSGQSLSKDYVVKQVDSLTSGIRSLKDLTLNRSKFIDQTNLYNDSYKLMMTRDQFKTLCSDFTKTFPAAQKIIDDLDEYVSLADQRNAAVLEYNQLWQHVYDLQAEAVKAEHDYQHAQSGLAGKAQPSLPIFTSFATERYNRAKDLTLHINYLASRAYILKSLKVRDYFSEMLKCLPEIGQINHATLTQAQLEHLYGQVMDELGQSGPKGPCTAHVVFQKTSHPKIFESLAGNGLASFPIRQPRKGTIGPFSGMANVRLTRVRCWAGGLALKKEHFFKLVHTGCETFVTSGGDEVIVYHAPVFLDYAYRPDTAIDPTIEDFEFKGYEKPMLLTDRFALIGPFTTWNIVLDDTDDRKKIESLRVEFDAMHQVLTPH